MRIYGLASADQDMQGLFVQKELGEKIFQQVALEGQDCNVEAEHYTADGNSKRWFSVSVRRAKNPVAVDSTTTANADDASTDDTSYVILMTARDITEVLQARKDTAEAKLKAEFLAVLAHDIRTPVSIATHHVHHFELLLIHFWFCSALFCSVQLHQIIG